MGDSTSAIATTRRRGPLWAYFKALPQEQEPAPSCLPLPLLASPGRDGRLSPPLLSSAAATITIPSLCFRSLSSSRRWEAWVEESLRDASFSSTLRSAAIADAVAASTAAIAIDRGALSALLSFWVPSTRTFVFPWGEAAFTLEDALVLGGLPASGAPLERPLSAAEDDLRLRLVVEKEKIKVLHPSARAARRVTSDVWLEWFAGLKGEDELRRLGFLAYWLACDIVPQVKSWEVPSRSFALAARLSLGERIALGPAATANLYSDINRIVAAALEGRCGRVDVWGPFGLLQAWMWEHYVCLQPPRPRLPKVPISTARILQWSRRKKSTAHEEAMRVFQDEARFEWRPYFHNYANWRDPEWFDEESVSMTFREKNKPEWFADYTAVIRPATLAGFYSDDMVTSERYNPHRVVRQLGYDQVVPVPIGAAEWDADGFDPEGIEVWIPSVARSGVASEEYTAWWNGHLESSPRGASNGSTVTVEQDLRAPETGQDEAAGLGLGAGKSTSNASEHARGKHKENEKVNRASLSPLDADTQKKIVEMKVGRSRKGAEQQKKSKCSKGEVLAQQDGQNQKNGLEKEFVLGLAAYDTISDASEERRRKRKEKKERRANLAADADRKQKKIQVKDGECSEEPQVHAEKPLKMSKTDKNSSQWGDQKHVGIQEEAPISHGKKCEVIHIDSDEECKILDPDKFDRGLVEELEEFVHSGLLTEWGESSDEGEGGARKRCKVEKRHEDPYAEEAIRRYPRFFELIPQKPHYRGLENIDENIREEVHQGQWFVLVDLTREALKTSCDTDASEIASLMKKAQKLEQLGFNVKHLVARLKEPQARLRKLQAAGARLEDAKRKEQEARGVETLASRLIKLKGNIWSMERHLDENKEAFGSILHDNLTEGIKLANLEKEVEAAEKYFQLVKDEVEAMSTKHLCP